MVTGIIPEMQMNDNREIYGRELSLAIEDQTPFCPH
jgi:hypothetical protein